MRLQPRVAVVALSLLLPVAASAEEMSMTSAAEKRAGSGADAVCRRAICHRGVLLSGAAVADPAAGAKSDATTQPAPEVGGASSPLAVGRPLEKYLAEPKAPFSRAYIDARAILSEDNSCSRFYGGPGPATRVLDRMAAQVQHETLHDSTVGIRMSGAVTVETDAQTGFSYRLFEKVKVNKAGPFYREWYVKGTITSARPIPNCGSFRPNSHKARVAMLLHELAHLVRSPAGGWLIPNDGGDVEKSRQNTALIEARCLEQIRALGK